MIEQERLYWNSRYLSGMTSGYGSYGEQLSRKLSWLSRLDGVRSITEVGCGDFNFGENILKIFPDADYLGLDISDVVVQKNSERFQRSLCNFASMGDQIRTADLLLCVDVLFHVYEDSEADALLHRLESAWTKYLALSAYEYDGLRANHIRIRKFDPSRFGTPILREIVEEDGQLYFYIFKR